MDTLERRRQINSLAFRALDVPTTDRTDFIRREAADPEVAASVQRVLNAEFLEACSADFVDAVEEAKAEQEKGPLADTEDDRNYWTVSKRYKPLKPLNVGGFGAVYLVLDVQLERHVAMKLLKHSRSNAAEDIRFVREMQTHAQIRCPGVATLFDAGKLPLTEGDRLFYTVELLDPAINLLSYCALYCTSNRQRIEVFCKVCESVFHVHRQHRIVHADLKPDNILMLESQPKVLDFGLAQLQGGRLFRGTPEYSSPEQADGQCVPSVDQYALGVILFEILSGKLPREFPSNATPQALWASVRSTEARRLRDIAPACSRDLESIVMRALSPDPAVRYESVAAFAGDLRRYLADEPVEAAGPHSRLRLLLLWRRRHRALVNLGVVIIALAIIGLFVTVLAQAHAQATERRLENYRNQRATDQQTLDGRLSAARDVHEDRYRAARSDWEKGEGWIDWMLDSRWIHAEEMCFRASRRGAVELLIQNDELRDGLRASLEITQITRWDDAALGYARQLQEHGHETLTSLKAWFDALRRRAELAENRAAAYASLTEAAEINDRIRQFDAKLAAAQARTIELSRAFLAHYMGNHESSVRHLDNAQQALDSWLARSDEFFLSQVQVYVWRFRWWQVGDSLTREQYAGLAAETIYAAITHANQSTTVESPRTPLALLRSLHSLIEREQNAEFGSARERLDRAIQILESRIPPAMP